MTLLDLLEAREARSAASISPTRNPRDAASRAAPAPVMPPPTTRRSSSSLAILSSAICRVEALSAGSAKQRPQRVIEAEVLRMQIVVDRAQPCVRLDRRGPRAGHRSRGVDHARMQTDARGGEHRCSPRCGLHVVRAAHAQARHISTDPKQKVASRAAADAYEPRELMSAGCDRVHDVTQGERVALEQSPGHMGAAMG